MPAAKLEFIDISLILEDIVNTKKFIRIDNVFAGG